MKIGSKCLWMGKTACGGAKLGTVVRVDTDNEGNSQFCVEFKDGSSIMAVRSEISPVRETDLAPLTEDLDIARSCTGKQKYPNASVAAKAIVRHPHLEPYRCRHCGHFHVGHKKRETNRISKTGYAK